MAWTTPMTATAGAFNAADWNTYIRDNLLETAPAIAATTDSRWFVSTAANAIAPRVITSDFVATEQTRSSTTYGDLSTAGPAVTLTTGTKALVMLSANIGCNTADQTARASFAISGDTTQSPSDQQGIASDGLAAASSGQNGRTIGCAHLVTVTAGTNTFTMKYKTDNASYTGRFAARSIVVWGF